MNQLRMYMKHLPLHHFNAIGDYIHFMVGHGTALDRGRIPFNRLLYQLTKYIWFTSLWTNHSITFHLFTSLWTNHSITFHLFLQYLIFHQCQSFQSSLK